MQIVQPGQNFSFNYTDPFQRDTLFIRFEVWDVSATPALVATVNGQYTSNGSYMGIYQGVAGDQFMVIGLVYTDGTYTTIDTSAGQTTDVYQIVPSNGSITTLGFSYASYDYSSALHLRATIWNMTSGAPVSAGNATMAHVAHGVYFGNYVAVADSTYGALMVVYTSGSFATPDTNYSPGSPSFSALDLPVVIAVEGTAHLIGGGQGQTGVITVNPPIHFTQGDNAVLQLVAVDVNGDPVDLTGATFSSQIQGANGIGPITFANGQHAANPDQVSFRGQFTLTLTQTNTGDCGEGEHKEILTTITIGGNRIYFRGFNALQVYSPVPFE